MCYKHIENEVNAKNLDEDLYELIFTGTRVNTKSDSVYLGKTIGLFSSIKTRVRESGPKLAGIMPAEEFICGARIGVTTLKLKRK